MSTQTYCFAQVDQLFRPRRDLMKAYRSTPIWPARPQGFDGDSGIVRLRVDPGLGRPYRIGAANKRHPPLSEATSFVLPHLFGYAMHNEHRLVSASVRIVAPMRLQPWCGAGAVRSAAPPQVLTLADTTNAGYERTATRK